MVPINRYWRTKKPCLDCSKLIAGTSLRCCSCNQKRRKKPAIIKLLVKRMAARRCSRKKTNALREKIYIKLGYKCVRCGFDDLRALHIDHVNDDGYKDKKIYKTVWSKYQAVIDDNTGKYQILCANCNFIKRHEALMRKEEERNVYERATTHSGNHISSGLGNI